MRNRKIILNLLTIIFVIDVISRGYACKCEQPATAEDGYIKSGAVVHGLVVSIDTVFLSEIFSREEAKQIEKELQDDQKGLNYFTNGLVLKIKFEIKQIFKGDFDSDTVIIYTPFHSATCGYKFVENLHYIVYASNRSPFSMLLHPLQKHEQIRKDAPLWTTHCTRTNHYSKEEANALSV